MQQNEQPPLTYEDLSQLWNIPVSKIQKAKKEAGEALTEGPEGHFFRDSEDNGRIHFSHAGQRVLASLLGVEMDQGAVLDPGVISPNLAEDMGRTMAGELAYPAAIAFFQHFPGAMVAHIQRMVSNPTEEEAPLVYGAMQLAMGAAADPKRYLPAQEGN
jgi:hypothetical protein